MSKIEQKEVKLEIELPPGGFQKSLYFNRFRVDREDEVSLLQFGLVSGSGLLDSYACAFMLSSKRRRVKRGSPPDKPIRRHKYAAVLPELMRDFGGRCAYSMQPHSRAGTLEVDHFDPRLKKELIQLYVLVNSQARIDKERAMRLRRLKRLWARLKELQAMKKLSRDELLKKLAVAQSQAGRVAGLVEVSEPAQSQEVNAQTFGFKLRKDKLRVQRRREGRYLLRSNLPAQDPGKMWEMYLLLAEIEAAFKNLKSDLRLRPIYHQLEERIEAHIFVAFLSLCLHVTLRGKLRPLAPGLTPRVVLDKLACIQMLDVYFPTTDGRKLRFRRYTKPEKDQAMLLAQMKLQLPPQPPPEITTDHKLTMS